MKHAHREIMNHQRLLHPHVVQLKEVFAAKPYLALVMEFVPNGDMFQVESPACLPVCAYKEGTRYRLGREPKEWPFCLAALPMAWWWHVPNRRSSTREQAAHQAPLWSGAGPGSRMPLILERQRWK